MPSTAIRALAYDPEHEAMFVTFVSGEIYAYAEVPRAVFEAFQSSGSRGRFFQSHVRDRYRYRRISGCPGGWTDPRQRRRETGSPLRSPRTGSR